MGDIAEAIIDGLFCQECGTVIDGDEPGYPRNCLGCQPKSVIKRNIRAKKQKYPCAICGKVIAEIGLPQHMRDKHSESRQAMAKKISDLQTQLDEANTTLKAHEEFFSAEEREAASAKAELFVLQGGVKALVDWLEKFPVIKAANKARVATLADYQEFNAALKQLQSTAGGSDALSRWDLSEGSDPSPASIQPEQGDDPYMQTK